MKSIQYLDEATVQSALYWDELIAAMEAALSGYSLGKVMQPLRKWLPIEEGQRYLAAMPAVMQEAMGLKVVSFYPRLSQSAPEKEFRYRTPIPER